MAPWNKQILLNTILDRATNLLDEDDSLRESPEFLQTVARHMLALCKHGGWVPDIDGWDPGFDEWAVTDIETADDFDCFLNSLYDHADADRIWCGLGHERDEFPKVCTDLGWLGDFSKFAKVPHGS